jgi:hypothetical protein
MDNNWISSLPLGFSPDIYVSHPLNQDISSFSAEEARLHYDKFGEPEGRICSAIKCRNDFITLVPPKLPILEIGPFFSPAFRKPESNVSYIDCSSTETLKIRAKALPEVNLESIPEIDYVWSGQPYSDLIENKFSIIFSAHNIEHQPCLLTHLNDMESVLETHGAVFLAIPDKRYCFDHFFAETNITDVIDAWEHNRKRHRLKDILDHRFFIAHNDPQRHWKGDNGVNLGLQPLDHDRVEVFLNVLKQFGKNDEYVDVHAWKFTPRSFNILFQNLFQLKLTRFRIARQYPTLMNSNEFYVVLVIDH